MKTFKNVSMIIMLLFALVLNLLNPLTAEASPRQAQPIAASETTFITLDGTLLLRTNVMSFNDILFMPARELLLHLGAVHESPNSTSFILRDKIISFQPRIASVAINDEDVPLSIAPFLYDSSLFIPIIEVAVILGEHVTYATDSRGRTVIRIAPYQRFDKDVTIFLNALNANGIVRNIMFYDALEELANAMREDDSTPTRRVWPSFENVGSFNRTLQRSNTTRNGCVMRGVLPIEKVL